MRTVTAVAHRGAPYRHRENTLDSLRAGLGLGADAVEFDVRTTRDGVPVLLHDSTLDRLWKVERPLSALSAAELSGLTAGGVPTLADALLATGDSRVMVDLPGAVNRRAVRRVLDVVREHEAEERVYYLSLNHICPSDQLKSVNLVGARNIKKKSTYVEDKADTQLRLGMKERTQN
ncbi:glycerophosphodiester phosphodiesterase, partial [Streptomyces scabiei]|uniref:glycerophosphodiester phosphodiesterase n=1 Tax=Streptomyces scabiei TaxID=1930 RepID=UPI0029B1C8C8